MAMLFIQTLFFFFLMFSFMSVMKHEFILRCLLPLLKNLCKEVRPLLYYSRMHILTSRYEKGLKVEVRVILSA